MPDRASSEGRAIRQVERLSNKLLTTAFEASLGCVAVMRRAKRRQRGSIKKKQCHGGADAWGCGRFLGPELSNSKTASKHIQCLSPAKKHKLYKSSINKSIHFV